jgi:predicted metalloprotease
MRWRGRRESDNVEDHRFDSPVGLGGMAGGGRGGGGMLRLLPIAIRILGVKGTIIAALIIGGITLFGGGDLASLLGGGQSASQQPAATQSPRQSAAEAEQVRFVKVVLADTEDTWHALMREQGRTYQEPRLVLFRDAVKSACGMGKAAMGPFYCPGDNKVYIDLSFFDDLQKRHGAPGDFAQAYVIAHEVGHHIQTLLGTSRKVHSLKQTLSKTEGNKLSVRQELQADCYAGIWAHHANRSRQLLEQGDIQEGLTAASAIGDDRLQKQARGYITPESFTHGTSVQRVRWFKVGYQKGTIKACDTFSATSL